MRFPRIERPLNSLPKAQGIIGEGETGDQDHLGFHLLCLIEVSKAIGVQSPWHLPYHPSLTVQMVLGIPDDVGGIGRKLI